MFYTLLPIIVALLALVAIGFALKVLLRKGWLLGWLRGMSGVILVSLAIVVGLSAFDIYSYRQIVEEESIGTISFEELEPQRYTAVLVDTKGRESRYELSGDQWQMDARFLKWPTALAAIGVKPGYRLDRISGRYYSLDQERSAERTVYSLNQSTLGVDVWEMFNGWGRSFKLVDAVYGSATFVPMADGALYEVRLSNTGLLARPLNDPARLAVERWQ